MEKVRIAVPYHPRENSVIARKGQLGTESFYKEVKKLVLPSAVSTQMSLLGGQISEFPKQKMQKHYETAGQRLSLK